MKNSFFIVILIFFSTVFKAYGYKEEICSSLAGINIATNAGISVRDQDLGFGGNPYFVSSEAKVRLFFDENSPKYYNSNFRAIVHYEIKLYDSNNGVIFYPLSHTIGLDYLQNGIINDASIDLHRINSHDVRRASLTVTSLQYQFLDANGVATGSPVTISNFGGVSFSSIKLELVYSATKYKSMSTNPTAVGHSVIGSDGGHKDMPGFIHHSGVISSVVGSIEVPGNELMVYWVPVIGAEWYDLEWVFIDIGTDSLNSNYSYSIDWQNATRIQTTSHFYRIPLLYPRGKIVYRVRGVGVDLSGSNIPHTLSYADWTNVAMQTANSNYVVFYEGMTPSLNWTSVTTYAEEGKQKSVVNVFDPGGKSRQVLTSLSTDSLLVVSEQVYDHMGRGSLVLLPIVEEFGGLYFQGLKNTSFGKEDFDLDVHYSTLANPGQSSPSMSGNSISDFYSMGNALLGYSGDYYPKIHRKTLAAYIPDAQGYAYQQTRFSNDGSGRPLSQGGAGAHHKLGSGHETKFYYGSPGSQAELDRFFGNEVGYVANYKKDMTVDANGQVSVSYKDGYDRVIATALAGDGTSSLLHNLPSGTGFPELTSSAIGNNHINGDGELEASKSILISSLGTPLQIQYTADSTMFSDICLGDHPCKFEVSISLVNEEGGHQLDFNGQNGVSDEPSFLPFGSNGSFTYQGSVTGLDIGKYTLVKRVRLVNYMQDQSFLAGVASYIGTDTSNAGPCFEVPEFDSPCMDCEQKCEDIFLFEYVHNNQSYTLYRSDTLAYVGLTNDSLLLTLSDPSGTLLFGALSQALKDSIDQLIADCKQICNSTPTLSLGTECDVLLGTLKRDLSPGGQYFDNNPMDPDFGSPGSLSYLDTNYTGSGSINYWLYNYADNSPLGINFLQAFGDLIGTSNANWHLIRFRWDDISSSPGFDSLMNIFVQIHPEYCLWKAKCGFKDQICECNEEGLVPLFSTLTDYESAMYGSNDDVYARDSALFIPFGLMLSGSDSIFNPTGLNNDYYCFSDPLMNESCSYVTDYNFRDSVHYKLLHFMSDSGVFFSIYDILTMGSYFRQLDTVLNPNSGYSKHFISYMKTLHGDGLSPGLLAGGFGDSLLPGQISWYTFFRSNYELLRYHYKNMLIKDDFMSCAPSNHVLYEAMQASSFPSPLNEKKHHLPFLTFLDGDGNGEIDVNLGNYGLSTLPSMDHNGFLIRIPYFPIPDMDDTSSLASQYCDGVVSTIPQLWLSSMEHVLTGCKDWQQVNSLYETTPHVISPADKSILSSYFTFIATEGCIMYLDSLNAGVYSSGSFTSGSSSPTAMSSFAWGAPSANNVDAVIDLYLSQYPQVGSCPKLSLIALRDTAYLNAQRKLDCGCSRLNSIVGASAGMQNGFENIYPFVYDDIPGSPSLDDVFKVQDIVQFMLSESDSLLMPYLTINDDLLRHWIVSCTQRNLPGDTSLPNLGVFPDIFGCTMPMSPPAESCEQNYLAYYSALRLELFNDFKEEQWERFSQLYKGNCLYRLRDKQAEELTLSYTLKEHHFTLYYYDRAGNLVKTVPPAGVKPINDADSLAKIAAFRKAHSWKNNYTSIQDPQFGSFIRPSHKKITHYQYDSKNQVIRQKTPDGGETFMYYDFLGRVAISENQKQRTDSVPKCSYTIYDELGRIVEVGEWSVDLPSLYTLGSLRDHIEQLPQNSLGQPGPSPYISQLEILGTRSQITRTYYDRAVATEVFGLQSIILSQNNLRNRVASVVFYEEKPSHWKYYDHATHYSYDVHGNVDILMQDFPVLQKFKKQFIRTEYEYDLISGKVNAVHFMKGEAEQFSHFYQYDADNRITKVFTSSNGGLSKELEAKYYYHLLGPLARVEYGKNQVQGQDFTYSIQGWLKGVNSDKLNPHNDRGADGLNQLTNLHRNFGVDAMGYSLGYFQGDYVPVGASGSLYKPFETEAAGVGQAEAWMSVNNTSGNGYGLYNGNIVKMVSNTLNCESVPMEVLGRFYRYDQLHRIKASRVATLANGGTYGNANTETWNAGNYGDRYKTQYDYDADGNILRLFRHDGSGVAMDKINYTYNGINNRLEGVVDVVQTPTILSDIEGTTSYSYDAIGNLVSDSQNDNSVIDWNVYGKVKSVDFAHKADLWFGYDAMGRRNVKRVTDQANNTQKAEIYALDAQGNVMAVYEINKEESEYVLSCKERMLYGSSRLGISKKKIIFENKSAIDMSQMENSVFQFLNPSDAMANEAFTADKKQKVWSGLKEYELTNHLGNVLATVSDRKLNKLSDVQNSQLQRYRPELRMSTEYYPFGSMLENWGCTSALECRQYSYLYADSLVTDHFTTGTVQDLIVEPYYGYDANNTTMSILSEANGNRYLQYNAAYIHQPILRSIPNLQHGKSYTLKIRGKVASGNAQITIRRYNKANPSNYGNATTKVINLNNNNWLGDSVVFTVDSAWRYVVHVRNSHNGASSIHIDDVRVYGMNTATYLACDTASVGYRFGFNSMPKDNEIYGSEGSGYDFGARIYDSRLGRWMAVDPLASEFPQQSPYCAMDNNPIVMNDPTGMAAEDPKDGGGGTCPTCPNGQKGDVHYTNNESGIGANGDMMTFPKGTTQAYVNLGDNQWSLGGFRTENGTAYNWNAEKSWYTDDNGSEYNQPIYMDVTNAVGNLMRPMVNMATDGIRQGDPFASVRQAKAASGESWGGFLWKGMAENITNLFASGYTGQQARLSLLTGMQASGGYMGVNGSIPLNPFQMRGGYGLFGKGGLKLGGYKVEALYSNPSMPGAGTFFSLKQMKQGGNLFRVDLGLYHKTQEMSIHGTYRFNLGGKTFGSSNTQVPFYIFKK